MDNIGREHIDINTLRLLYIRYKVFIVPFLVIVVVIGVFIKVNVPAIEDLLKGYEERKSEKLTLEVMRNNLLFLKSINSSSLDSQFRIVSKALPLDKDFYSILNAISDTSNISGIELGGFKFTVGNLSEDIAESEYQSLGLILTLNGNVDAASKFIGSLVKTFPLSEITKISAEKDSSVIAIDFYYKMVKALKSNDSLPITLVSGKGQKLIDELSIFRIPQTESFDSSSIPVSTPSANPFF